MASGVLVIATAGPFAGRSCVRRATANRLASAIKGNNGEGDGHRTGKNAAIENRRQKYKSRERGLLIFLAGGSEGRENPGITHVFILEP